MLEPSGAGRSLRAIAVLALLLTCTACALALQPARAHATVFSLVAANDAGEPLDEGITTVTTQDVLWARVATPTGTTLCVHPVPVPDNATCEGPGAWGGGVAPYLFQGYVPVAGPALEIGTWQVIAVSQFGAFGSGALEAVSQPFTVTPCDVACGPGEQPDTTAAKAVFKGIYDSMYHMCQSAMALSLAKTLQAAKNDYEDIVLLTGSPGAGWGVAIAHAAADVGEGMTIGAFKPDKVPYLPSAIGWGMWAMCKSFFGTSFPDNPVPWTDGFGIEIPGPLAGITKWLQDPPKPYEEIAHAAFVDWSRIDLTGFDPSPGVLALPRAVDRMRGELAAGTTSWERYQGALATGDDALRFQHAQAAATAGAFRRIAQAVTDAGHAAAALATTVQTDGTTPETLTQDQIDRAGAVRRRVRDTGFTAGELTQMHDAGLGAAGIEELRQQIAGDTDSLAAGDTFTGALTQLSAALRGARRDLDEFARGAAALAHGTNSLPAAAFDLTPASGAPPLTVHVTDTSTSADLDPLGVAWDFGDGTTKPGTEGGTAAHTYTTPGEYTVTETVSDGLASAAATKTVTVTAPVNVAPTASFTAKPQAGTVPLDVAFDASASGDADGTITSYDWTFGDGATDTGRAPTHRYLLDGTYTATLTVTDDRGATATATRTVTADAPNGPPLPADDQLEAAGSDVLDVLANDTDQNGDRLTVTGASAPAHGHATCAPGGGCQYDADAGYTGSDAFTYTVRDPGGLTATATVGVTVTAPPSAAPIVAGPDTAVTRPTTAVTIGVLANDAGAPPLTVAGTTDPRHGTVACTPAGACTYTPANGFSGTDGFTYGLADADGRNARGDVRVVVAPADAGFAVEVAGGPKPAVTQGQGASWGVGVTPTPAGADGEALGALAPPSATAELAGQQRLEPGSVRTAPGWTADPATALDRTVRAHAGPGALLGAASETVARPLPPVSQGLGGDGYVPIVIGDRVFAVFHIAAPTSVTCVERSTGTLCPGYPRRINMSGAWIPGPAAIVGTRFYVHLWPTGILGHDDPVSLFCWDTATGRPCGLIIVDRMQGLPSGSPPQLVGGRIYFAGDTGRLYCVDPATNASCATPSIPTGLGAGKGAEYDSVAHGTRVFVARSDGKVACVDVAAGTTCPGWSAPRDFGERWNVVNRLDAAGRAVGVCLIRAQAGDCVSDADPGSHTSIADWPGRDDYWSTTQEAQVGSRTFVASNGTAGAACWDWTTSAPCTGGGYGPGGWVGQDTDGNALPTAYGVMYDGACVVALGDPGLVFTVDPGAGVAPCTGLAETRASVDLRDQRCDGTVGAATWTAVSLTDAAAGELASATVTVRDAATDAILATKDVNKGALDLSGIDAAAHPAVVLTAKVVSTAGDPAWADAVPPRLRLTWHADPRQLCFDTTTAPECDQPVAPISVAAHLGDPAVKAEDALGLLRAPCPPRLGAVADRGVDEQAPLSIAVGATDPNGGALRFSLADAPPGTAIDPATGVLTWTPTEEQGPAAHGIRVRVTDAGGLADERTFTVTVAEVNRPPTVTAPGDQALEAGQPLAVQAQATDPDLPRNGLAFSLPAAPPGASIDAGSGAVSWASPPAGRHAFTVRVTDDGHPALSAERSFTVDVAAPKVEERPAAGGAPAPAQPVVAQSAGDLILGCSDRRIVLEDVVPQGNRVRLIGVADRSFAGKRVDLVFMADGKVVARAVVGSDGSFTATAPMPPARLRGSNRARYQARVGGDRSLNLKLARRMLVTSVQATGAKVTISGRVAGPLAPRRQDRTIGLERLVTCSSVERIASFSPRPDGTFKVTVDKPAGQAAAVYRLRTKVRESARNPKLSSTFTLPRAVDFR